MTGVPKWRGCGYLKEALPSPTLPFATYEKVFCQVGLYRLGGFDDGDAFALAMKGIGWHREGRAPFRSPRTRGDML